jgi:sugar phosphate isomerase/epimerase
MAKIWRSSERDALDVIGDRDISLSTIGMFGNPVEEQPMDLLTLPGWRECIDHAHHFGVRVGAGFTGRIRGHPLAENLARNRQIWTDRQRAADRGVNIALKIAPWQLGERRLEDCA